MKAKITYLETIETTIEVDVPDDIAREHTEVVEAWTGSFILENPNAGKRKTIDFSVTNVDITGR